jgi:anti-sigma factor RsiW
MPDLTYSCQRACALASRGVDGELSEIESRVLERHLRLCSGCRAFLAEIEGIASLMRATPLEPYRMETVPRLGHAKRSMRRLIAATSSATLVAAAVLGIVVGVTPPSDEFGPTQPSAPVYFDDPVPPVSSEGRGVPIVTRMVLPLGQRNAVDDF